jgi:hypothetical protein
VAEPWTDLRAFRSAGNRNSQADTSSGQISSTETRHGVSPPAHRAHGKEANTLSGLTTEIAHLRTALDAIATTVRRHEEELRRLRKTQR